tara:strand:- start:1221 stop:1463 length:243 start_codon:yes stop_codon:yes gene_type:complete
MSDFRNKIIDTQGKMFQVKRTFPENRINLNKGSVDDLKSFFHCDTLFKAQGLLWVCNEIKEIDYVKIEETSETQKEKESN